MNNLRDVLKHITVHNYWESAEEMAEDFECDIECVPPYEDILFAVNDDDYEGRAVIAFIRDDKLFMVSAKHGPYDGIAGQWRPKEVSIAQLEKYRAFDHHGSCFGPDKTTCESWAKMIEVLKSYAND